MRFVSPSVGWAKVATDAFGQRIRTWAVTNTMDGLSEAEVLDVNPAMHAHAQGLFGEGNLESYVLGCRKPNGAAFVAACDYFDVQPARVLFIDDEAGNCRGAEAVGMTAVHACDIAAQQLARQRLALAD